MDIKVIEKEEMKVVGISWNGTYSQMHTIPFLFEEMEARLREVSNQTDDSILIAPFHSRETELTYYVTAQVNQIEDVPEGMVGFTIPRKNYISSAHRGSMSEIEYTYKQMLAWMEDYGYELDNHALSLKIFKDEHNQVNAIDNLFFDILLPVKTY